MTLFIVTCEIVLCVLVIMCCIQAWNTMRVNRKITIANKSCDELFKMIKKNVYYLGVYRVYCMRMTEQKAKRKIVRQYLADNDLMRLRKNEL